MPEAYAIPEVNALSEANAMPGAYATSEAYELTKASLRSSNNSPKRPSISQETELMVSISHAHALGAALHQT